MIQTNTLEKLRSHVTHKYISSGNQLLYQRDTVRMVDVERQAFLAAVV